MKKRILSLNLTLAEESLYRGGFPLYKDTQLMKKFHSSSWDEKFKISNEFHDHRFTYFAQRIIYEEAPEVLPKSFLMKYINL